jgi:hypothetical protein
MGHSFDNALSLYRRNQDGSDGYRDYAKAETGPPLAPDSVSVLQIWLKKSFYEEVCAAYGGNQASKNRQQEISHRHVAKARPKYAEWEHLVENDIGGQQEEKMPQRHRYSALKLIAVMRSFGRHSKTWPLSRRISLQTMS